MYSAWQGAVSWCFLQGVSHSATQRLQIWALATRSARRTLREARAAMSYAVFAGADAARRLQNCTHRKQRAA
jgi:hypothetical protein